MGYGIKFDYVKFLKHIFYGLLVFTGLAALAAALIGHYYRDELKKFVKEKINENLASPVDVNGIDFSVFEKFPNASVSLNEVLAWDAFPGQESEDTLFYAEKIYFEFNLTDLIRKTYRIRQIEVYKAEINLKWNRKGEYNFKLWKDRDSVNQSSAGLDLESVKFRKCRLTLVNDKIQFRSWYVINKLDFNARIESGHLSFDIRADVPAFAYRSKPFEYATDKSVFVDTQMDILTEKGLIEFKNGKVKLGRVSGNATGTAGYKNGIYLFSFDADGQDLNDILEILPPAIPEKLKGYEIAGKAGFRLITGNKSGKNWKTTINFEISHADAGHIGSGIAVKNLSAAGKLDLSSKTNTLNLESYKGNFAGNGFEGRLRLKNFSHPQIDWQLKGAFDLNRLLGFLDIKNVEDASGSADVDFHITGKFREPGNIRAGEIEKAVTNGRLDIHNMWFTIPEMNMKFGEMNGTFVLDDNDAEVQNLSGIWKGSRFKLDGIIHNLIPFILFKNQKLYIRANGQFDHIRLENFFSDEENPVSRTTYQIPCYLDIEMNSVIGKLTYRSFEADDIHGVFSVKDCMLKSDNFRFNTSGGRVSGNMTVDNSPDGSMNLKVKGMLDDIDIDELFREFENFGQNTLRYNQIKGKLTAAINFYGSWDRNLNPDLGSIDADAIVNIDKGELIRVESLMGIGEYLRKNPVAGTVVDTRALDEKLQHIRFSRLTNRIIISGKAVHIPEMTILSSAMDINLSGTHYFDNRINYKLNFYLRQLIKQRKETEFGTIEDDGLGMRIFMNIGGTVDDPVFEMDKESRKSYKKSKWESEKKEVSEIFKNEIRTIFGDNQEKPAAETGERKFEIEWDDDTIPQQKTVKKDTLKKKRKKFIFEDDEENVRDADDDDY